MTINAQTSWLVALLIFGAVSFLTYPLIRFLSAQLHIQKRLKIADGSGVIGGGLGSLITSYVDEKKFGIEGDARTKLRYDLINAGYFNPHAIKYYIFIRLMLGVGVLVAAYVVTMTGLVDAPWSAKICLVLAISAIAIFGPQAYISRRRRILTQKYRIVFPDMLDLMVVCIDAGLSLEAALERVSRHLIKQQREMGMHLVILGTETRAGRSIIDALQSFAERLGLEEARSFVALMRQSVELGTDVGEALRVFSDEMRDKRLLRAEERANQLPVKMVLPLAMFIFPVILMTIMVPVALRLMTVLK